MKSLILAACLALAGAGFLSATPAQAQTAAQSAQQQKMKDCNAQAKSQKLAGDARKSFMSQCLGGKPAASPAQTAQRQKMKDCSAKAKSQKLAGDARKTFMSQCLKG